MLQFAAFLFVLWATMIRAPFEDMLQWLDAYQRYRQTGDGLAYLFGFFQEHRLVWAKLLTALDASAFQAGGLPFIAVGVIALAGVTALLTWEFVRGLPRGGPFAALAWLCPMLVLTAANAVDCSVPVNVVYPLALLFVVSTCVLFDGPGEAGRGLHARRIAAVLMAAAAGFANAIGLLAWPVLLWSAWRCRAGARWVIVIAVLGGCYGAAYLHGLVRSDLVAAPPVSMIAHVAKQVAYLLAYLGLPLSRVPALRVAGQAWGAVLLTAGIAASIRYGLLKRQVTRLERIATGLILFSLGGGVLAAIGRVDFAAGIELPVRYSVLITPLNVGLLALVLSWLANHPAVSRRSGAVLAGGVAVAVVLLAQQVGGGRAAIKVADRMRSTIDRYYAGEHDADIQQLVYQSGLAKADAIVSNLRRDGLLAR